MSVSTKYLGLELKSPLVASASPLSRNLDVSKRLEDAGAAALVMYSLFQEEAVAESLELDHYLSYFTEAFAEALTWYPELPSYRLIPDRYLEQLRLLKAHLDIPVIGSLNGVSTGGWTSYARQIEEAGADALELNLYHIPDLQLSGEQVEQGALDVLRTVKTEVGIPVAVKLSPYYSSIGSMAKKLEETGADALVMFNRFYQPDLDVDELEVVPRLDLSTSVDLRLALRWVAMLYGRTDAEMAVTGGVHTHEDVVKAIMAGAQVTMMTSELLERGVGRITEIERDLQSWMERREFSSVDEMRGTLSQQEVEDPSAFERANYVRVLQSWRPDPAGGLFREILRS